MNSLSIMDQVLRAAGFIIFRRTNKVPDVVEYLLLQTSYGQNHWTPPKGHVDLGEDDITTALRETEEEAGIKSNCLKILEDTKITLKYIVNNEYVKNKSKIVVYWPAEVNFDQPVKLSNEHQDFKWLNIDEACKLCVFEDMQKALKEVHNKIVHS